MIEEKEKIIKLEAGSIYRLFFNDHPTYKIYIKIKALRDKTCLIELFNHPESYSYINDFLIKQNIIKVGHEKPENSDDVYFNKHIKEHGETGFSVPFLNLTEET